MTTQSVTTKTSPGLARLKKNLGPEKSEALRQTVIADQAKAQTEAAKTKTATKTAKGKPTKSPPTKKADNRKITVLGRENPHAAGSRRAGWFKQLKTGMMVAEAIELGVRSVYLQRMAAKGIIKIS